MFCCSSWCFDFVVGRYTFLKMFFCCQNGVVEMKDGIVKDGRCLKSLKDFLGRNIFSVTTLLLFYCCCCWSTNVTACWKIFVAINLFILKSKMLANLFVTLNYKSSSKSVFSSKSRFSRSDCQTQIVDYILVTFHSLGNVWVTWMWVLMNYLGDVNRNT